VFAFPGFGADEHERGPPRRVVGRAVERGGGYPPVPLVGALVSEFVDESLAEVGVLEDRGATLGDGGCFGCDGCGDWFVLFHDEKFPFSRARVTGQIIFFSSFTIRSDVWSAVLRERQRSPALAAFDFEGVRVERSSPSCGFAA
jgi:hypothetical protein